MSTTNIIDRLPLGAGVVTGIAAYLLGYLVTYVWQSGSIEDRLEGFNFIATLLGSDPVPPWQGVGWLFYNAHFVDTQFEVMGTQSENLIAASDGGSLALLYFVPIGLLLAAGLLLARLTDAEDLADGAAAGGTVVLGYAPLAVLGGFLFSYNGVVAPDLVTTLLLAGLLYPLVFGGIGGVVGSMLGSD